jgi:hypothetical protein
VTRPPADGDRRGDLVRGLRAVRGTVERDGAWLILRTRRDSWALLGNRAHPLADGQEVVVRGTVTALPPGCPADRALTVIR